MQRTLRVTTLIEREGNDYVSICPDLDIASQGKSIEEARENLQEAVGLFFETASESEIQERLHSELYVTPGPALAVPNSVSTGTGPARRSPGL